MKKEVIKSRKKWSLKILKVFIIMLISLSILVLAGFSKKDDSIVIADSGFGTSYDSGGSSGGSDWSSSSSSSYDYDYGSSSGSGGGSLAGTLVVFGIIMLYVIISSMSKSGKQVPQTTAPVNDEAVANRIKQYIPNFNKQQFLADGYKIYLDVQNAWMNFKLDDVKGVITDEMFNMYQDQLDTLEVKGQQNVMKDFKNTRAYLKDVSAQNNTITITAVYVVEFYDYIAEQATGKVLRGSSTRKVRSTYEMKFRKTLNEKAVTDTCPSCGAKIEDMNGAGVCKYCGSKLVYDNAKWVLTEKKTVGQTML